MGNCQDCMDKLDDAIASYDTALRMDPDDAEAWFNKGMTLKKKGQINESTMCIEKCINLSAAVNKSFFDFFYFFR